MKTEPDQRFQKALLRKEIRHWRSRISDEQRKAWDAAINRQLDTFTRQSGAEIVAAYMAFDGEPDLMPFLADLENRGVQAALPVVQDGPGKEVISFRNWSQATEMRRNRYGISEPTGTGEIRVTDLDIVLVPLVAWDRNGGRLGMGASYYDRLFQPFSEYDRPLRMGVGYELQHVERIPSDPWDVSLHGVVTENGWFTFEH